MRQLEGELAAIVDRLPVLTEEQKSAALAYLVIGPDGEPRIHEQLYAITPEEDEDTDESTDDGDAGDDAANNADVMAPTKPAISQRLADELAMMKTEVLALHVASDVPFALDLGTFIMIEAATRPMGSYCIPSDLRATAPAPRVADFESGAPAAARWTELEEALDRSWTGLDTIEERYDAFCALSEEARAAWLGWAIARTLHAVPTGKTGSAFLDHLGAKLAIDMAAWWRPTARTYFDHITKPAILDLFAEIGGPDLRTRYGASKKHDLAASAEKLFAGETVVEAEIKERALVWLPDEMLFGVPKPVDEGAPDSNSHDDSPPWQVDTDPAELPQAA